MHPGMRVGKQLWVEKSQLAVYAPVQMSKDLFERAVRKIGSYRAVGALFDPPISAQAVQKWGGQGIPERRVIAVSAAAGFDPSPHELCPDLYPHPDDGLPASLRGRLVS